MTKLPPKSELSLSVLVYREDDLQVAHCLEMDLKGRGKNDKEAMLEMMELVLMQVSFAYAKGEPGLLDNPAEQKYFRKFRQLQRQAIASFPEKPKTRDFSSFRVPMPEPRHECFAF